MIRYMLLRGFFPPHAEESSKEYRKNWARLISKIYEVDPLTCPKCHGPIRVISFIEDQDVIKKILKHLGLWEVKPRPPPRIPKAQPTYTEPWIDYSDSQFPLPIRGLSPYLNLEQPIRLWGRGGHCSTFSVSGDIMT